MLAVNGLYQDDVLTLVLVQVTGQRRAVVDDDRLLRADQPVKPCEIELVLFSPMGDGPTASVE